MDGGLEGRPPPDLESSQPCVYLGVVISEAGVNKVAVIVQRNTRYNRLHITRDLFIRVVD